MKGGPCVVHNCPQTAICSVDRGAPVLYCLGHAVKEVKARRGSITLWAARKAADR